MQYSLPSSSLVANSGFVPRTSLPHLLRFAARHVCPPGFWSYMIAALPYFFPFPLL